MVIAHTLIRALRKTEGLLKRETIIGALRWIHSDDPLEKLYQEKLVEYNARSSGGKMFEPSKEILAELESELTRIAQKYGAKSGSELENFPKMEFKEPVIDPVLGGFKFDEPKKKGEEKKTKEEKDGKGK